VGRDLFKIIATLIFNPMNLSKNIEKGRQRTIQLSNRFVTKIRTDKSNGSILLELSMPTYGCMSPNWLLFVACMQLSPNRLQPTAWVKSVFWLPLLSMLSCYLYPSWLLSVESLPACHVQWACLKRLARLEDFCSLACSWCVYCTCLARTGQNRVTWKTPSSSAFVTFKSQ
jgi:hypothetical protein